MIRRLFPLVFIYGCTAIAWLVLGSTVFQRTYSADSRLRGSVGSTWGVPQSQHAPIGFSLTPDPLPMSTEARKARAAAKARGEEPEVTYSKEFLPLDQTRASVTFDLDHRQKGLLWYSTYAVSFSGAYKFRNNTPTEAVTLEFKLPAAAAIYDDLHVNLNGTPVTYRTVDQALVIDAAIPLGDVASLDVGYHSRGLDQWNYALGKDVSEVRDFDLTMRTDFGDIDFPDNTLSPTAKKEVSKGWELQWKYKNLLSGFQIGMSMPQKLQPGPLAGKIAYFAPVSLLFFFAVIFMVTTIRRIELHPMNYAFIAAGFFAFHLLLAYLVDHVSIHIAFLIASVVSVTLVVSYLRLAVGPRFAFVEAAYAQSLYLVLFSYAFFFKGFTGLAITVGSIVTLFVAMQLTGRVRWSELLAAEPMLPRPGDMTERMAAEAAIIQSSPGPIIWPR